MPNATLSQPSLLPQTRHRSVDQRSSGLETTDGNAWISGPVRSGGCAPASA